LMRHRERSLIRLLGWRNVIKLPLVAFFWSIAWLLGVMFNVLDRLKQALKRR